MAYVWLTKSDLAKGVTEDELTRLAGTAVVYEGVPRPKREDMLKMLDAFYVAKGADSLTYQQYMNVMCCWNVLETVPKVQEWTMRLYQSALGSEEARGKVTMKTLDVLAIWLFHSQMTAKGKGYPCWPRRWRGMPVKGRCGPPSPSRWGRPWGRRRRGNWFGPSFSMPRGCRVWGRRSSWHGHTGWSRGSSRPGGRWWRRRRRGTEGDARAYWLVVEGYTDPLIPAMAEPLRRQRWLQQALAAAVSEPTRLAVLEEMVRFHRQCGVRAPAVDLLESVKNQFGAEAKASIDAMQESLRAEDAECQAQAARDAAASQIGMNRALLVYLRKCLESSKDDQQKAGLQAAIADAEKQLGR